MPKISTAARDSKSLLLIGGGHTHALLLLHLKKRHIPKDWSVTLLSDSRCSLYSGMLPGWLAGHYTQEQLQIPIADLCQQAGVTFREERVKQLDAHTRTVTTDKGTHHYGVASLNLGISSSLPAGCSSKNTHFPLKPINDFMKLAEKFFLLIEKRKEDALTIVVVGGGAGGVEVACALAWRLRQHLQIQILLVCRSFLPGYSPKVRKVARERVLLANINIKESFSVVKGEGATLVSDAGETLKADYTFWSTPGEPAGFLKKSHLALDSSGFVRLNPMLQSVSHPNLFACGDIASLPTPIAKAGVYAVRQAPCLAQNLFAMMTDQKCLQSYKAQTHFLTILSLGEKKALAEKKNRVGIGSLIWRWKNYLDSSFMRKFFVS